MDLGFPLDIFFASVFLPSTSDPALCFRFKNEFSTSALFCFLLFSRTLLLWEGEQASLSGSAAGPVRIAVRFYNKRPK
jgi:hypothetical protein